MRWTLAATGLLLAPALAVTWPVHVRANDLVRPFAESSRKAGDHIQGSESNPFDRSEVGTARRSGDILPMWEVVRRLGPALKGQVVDTDITRRGGHWLYEFQVLRADGELVRVWADATSGQLAGSGR